MKDIPLIGVLKSQYVLIGIHKSVEMCNQGQRLVGALFYASKTGVRESATDFAVGPHIDKFSHSLLSILFWIFQVKVKEALLHRTKTILLVQTEKQMRRCNPIDM